MARNIRRGTEKTAPGGGRGAATASRYKRDEEETPYEEEDRDSHYKDEGEERPARRGDAAARKGWGAARQQAKDNTDFAERLTLKEDDSALVKFIEDEPFVVYAQHWIDKKPYLCGEFAHADCPLCDVGAEKGGRAAFNVVVLVNDAEDPDVEEFPRLVVWEVPPSVIQALEDIHLDDRKGPLDKEYVEVTKYKKKNNFVDYKIETVKERDVLEDWKVDPLSDEEIDEFLASEDLATDEDYPYVTPYDKLVETARELSGRGRGRDDDDEDEKPRRGRREPRDRGSRRRR